MVLLAVGISTLLSMLINPVSAQTTHTSSVTCRPDLSAVPSSALTSPGIHSSETITSSLYLPILYKPEVIPGCEPIPGASYSTLSVMSPPTDRPAEEHADLNLALRSYEPTTAYLGLVDVDGPADPYAPDLHGLFSDGRAPTFTRVYHVYDWDWSCNCRGNLLTDPEVTLIGLSSTTGETIHVPDSGYSIGTDLIVPQRGVMLGAGYEVLVLYASTERVTLKYTREDNVVNGYTIHVENICVEPSLLALYELWNENGRSRLPALMGGQAVGRARGEEIQVSIRDCGTFMDPRSRKDWW